MIACLAILVVLATFAAGVVAGVAFAGMDADAE